jgi:hypothetical protein
VVFFDALRVNIREEAVVRGKAVYLALGVLPDGTRDILGRWRGLKGAASDAPYPAHGWSSWLGGSSKGTLPGAPWRDSTPERTS